MHCGGFVKNMYTIGSVNIDSPVAQKANPHPVKSHHLQISTFSDCPLHYDFDIAVTCESALSIQSK